MKQKIVIQVAMHCDKSRSKALKIAAVAQGRLSSLALEGENRDRVVVIGEEVDPVNLTKFLRKKFSHANIVSVEEVKEEKKEENKPTELPLYYYPPCAPPYVVSDQYPYNNYFIM